MNNKLRAVKGLVTIAVALAALGSPNLAYAKSPEKKEAESKIKDGIDTAANALKKGVEKCGDKIEDVQNYFRRDSFSPSSIADRVGLENSS